MNMQLVQHGRARIANYNVKFSKLDFRSRWDVSRAGKFLNFKRRIQYSWSFLKNYAMRKTFMYYWQHNCIFAVSHLLKMLKIFIEVHQLTTKLNAKGSSVNKNLVNDLPPSWISILCKFSTLKNMINKTKRLYTRQNTFLMINRLWAQAASAAFFKAIAFIRLIKYSDRSMNVNRIF